MKQFLLITLIGGLAASAQAQDYGHRDDRNHSSRNERFNGRHRDQLERRIAFINNDFNDRIENVRRQPFLRASEKRRKIRALKREREVALD